MVAPIADPPPMSSLRWTAEMETLFARASQQGLWFYCPHVDLWFSPEELREKQRAGCFCWTQGSWELRDPVAHLAALRASEWLAKRQVKRFQERLQEAGVVIKDVTARSVLHRFWEETAEDNL